MDYSKIINKNIQNIPPSGIRRFFDAVNEIPDAISLGVGEPDFITPWSIRDAAIKSAQKGYTQYTSNSGLRELRDEISKYLKSRFRLDYSAGEILVTVGASEAIDLAVRTLVSPGDEAIIPDPSYVSYAPVVTVAGGVPVAAETFAEDEFRLTAENIEKRVTPKTKVIILPYPNNPTGAVMGRADLERILPVIKKHNLLVITDEIYAELTYGAAHVSVAALKDMRERTVYISGFSKAFAMTGWRVGYVCAPAEIAAAMLKLHQYTIMCAPTFSQYAALSALRTGAQDGYAETEEMKRQYDRRRRFLTAAFNGMGMDCFTPRGAFYCFPSVKKFGVTGDEFARGLLKEQKVVVIPGSAFGQSGKYFVRACYAADMTSLRAAAERIAVFAEAFTK